MHIRKMAPRPISLANQVVVQEIQLQAAKDSTILLDREQRCKNIHKPYRKRKMSFTMMIRISSKAVTRMSSQKEASMMNLIELPIRMMRQRTASWTKKRQKLTMSKKPQIS